MLLFSCWEDEMMYPVPSRRVRTVPLFIGEEAALAADLTTGRSNMLADPALQKRLEERIRKMEDTMQREMIKAAATQAAINLSLNAIPIVGSALSIVSAGVLAHQAERYQEKLEEYGKQAGVRIQKHLDAGMEKLNKRTQQVFEEEFPRAMEELFGASGQSVEGFDGLGFIKRVVKEVKRTARRVGKEIDRTGDTIQQGIDVIRGKRAYEKGKEQIDKMVQEQKAFIDSEVAAGMKESQTPQFRAAMRSRIQNEARKDPEFAALEREFKTTSPGVIPGVSNSARNRFRLIVAASAGVGLLLMLR